MINRENVIKGLECCTKEDAIRGGCFSDCPYFKEFPMTDGRCITALQADALDLLKDQEAEAKWIYGEDKTGVDGWHCSECDFFEPWFYEYTDDIDFIRFYGHCPKCGRRMTSYTGKPTQERR